MCFRAAIGAMLKQNDRARTTAQSVLLRDRHGRRCGQGCVSSRTKSSACSIPAATRHLYRSHIPSGAERMAVVATAVTAAADAPESDIDLCSFALQADRLV